MSEEPVRTGLAPAPAQGPTSASRVAISLRDDGPQVISGLATRLDLSRPTVEAGLAVVESLGLVVRGVAGGTGAGETSAGRPARSYRFVPDAALAAGIDLGPRGIRVAVVDLAGQHVGGGTVPRTGDDPVGDVVGALRGVVADTGRLGALCLAVPGHVASDGVVTTSPIIPALKGRSVAAELSDALGCRAEVENDTVLAGVAERLMGTGRGAQDVVVVHLGRRLSVSLTIGGRPHMGVDRTAGSIAHLFGSHIDSLGQLTWTSAENSRAVLAEAAEGAGAATGELESVLTDLGRGVATLVLALNPEVVVLGGDIGVAMAPWLPRIRAAAREQLNVPSRLDVRVSPLGGRATVLGAALAAVEAASSLLLGDPVPPPRLSIDVGSAAS